MAGPARLVASVEEAKPLDRRGRRLVTTRSCRRGEVLLREAPLIIWGPDARTDVDIVGWQKVGEALGDFDALAALSALRKTPAEVQASVKRLDGAFSSVALDMSSELAGLDDGSPFFEDVGDELAEMAGIIAANAAENVDGRRAVYANLSMANHACIPNATWRTADAASGEKELVCIASCIAEGEEVCISYLPERELFMLGREKRQLHLREAREFDCLCSRCSAETSVSDTQDKELAELTGKLLAGSPQAADKESAVKQCKEIGADLRRLDSLWPAASALKASIWKSYVDLLLTYGAPQALLMGAVQRFLEESRTCLAKAAYASEEKSLMQKLLPLAESSKADDASRDRAGYSLDSQLAGA